MKISSKMRSKGMIRTAQKPNMIHLLRMARRALRRSNSLGAKGLATVETGTGMARSARMSDLVGFFDPFDDEIGRHVDRTGDDEEHDAEDEENAVMIAPVDSLAHFRGDGSGHRSD